MCSQGRGVVSWGESRRLGAGVITLVSAVVASMVLLGSGEAMASGGPPVAPTGPVVGVRTNDSAAANVQSSGNWAGYNRAGPAGQFHAISGSWNVPTVQKHGTGDQFSSQWVGIGGGCNSCRSIVQAGSAQNLVGGSHQVLRVVRAVPAVSGDSPASCKPG